jgi:hypothetical protein
MEYSSTDRIYSCHKYHGKNKKSYFRRTQRTGRDSIRSRAKHQYRKYKISGTIRKIRSEILTINDRDMELDASNT